MIETKKKITFTTDKIQKLIEDTKKPMSLKEIENKFGVSYPYKVKGVKDITLVESDSILGKIFTISAVNHHCPKSRDYIESEVYCFDANIKRWQLWE